jgi:hypothetical protein
MSTTSALLDKFIKVASVYNLWTAKLGNDDAVSEVLSAETMANATL